VQLPRRDVADSSVVVEMLDHHVPVQAKRRHQSGKKHVELRTVMH
jgi:hypothetical protein